VRQNAQRRGCLLKPFHGERRKGLNGRERVDVRQHRETKERPIDRHRRELKFPLPLPNRHGKVADVEGNVAYDSNSYSVPCIRIGGLVVVRATGDKTMVQ